MAASMELCLTLLQVLSPVEAQQRPEAVQPAGQAYYLELGVFSSVRRAERAIDRGMKIVGVQTGSIIEIKAKRANRAVMSGFPTMDEAQAACAKLAATGRYCEAKPIYP